MPSLDELRDTYLRNRRQIRDFLERTKERDSRMLEEMFFCMLTAQSKAAACRASVDRLKGCRDLFEADIGDIRKSLHGVRFADRKAQYLFEAKEKLQQIKENLSLPAIEQREWLVENVKGMGMKLASHYLRNIGVFGLAILDVHVQRFMKENWRFHGEVGKLTKSQYLENEQEFLGLAKELGMRPEELDIAIWMLGNGSGNFYG
ncbi:MAG: hypothetical protein QXU82_02870 [Candidatus Aenigmatarchaeota archaeon]